MWFLGHTALGFGLAGLVVLVTRTRPVPARVLVLVPFLANLIDVFHPDPIRDYSHNFVAAVGLPLAAVLIWGHWTRWSRVESATLLAGAMGAPLGDLIFGSFYPYAPIAWTDVEWMEFNSSGDLVTEAILGLGLIAVLLLLLRRSSGARALIDFRGPWVIAPTVAVLATAALFWGEVAEYLGRAPWATEAALAAGVLAEMVASAAVVTGLGVAAVFLWRRDQKRDIPESI